MVILILPNFYIVIGPKNDPITLLGIGIRACILKVYCFKADSLILPETLDFNRPCKFIRL